MENKEEILSLFLTFLAMVITFIVPLPLSENSRLSVTGAILIFYITISIFRFNKKLNDCSEEIKKLGEKLKIYERLSKIEAKLEINKK